MMPGRYYWIFTQRLLSAYAAAYSDTFSDPANKNRLGAISAIERHLPRKHSLISTLPNANLFRCCNNVKRRMNRASIQSTERVGACSVFI